MLGAGDSLAIGALRARYLSRDLRPADMVTGIFERISARGDDKVWIDLYARQEVEARCEALENEDPAGLPLYGIPFAIKDNIDVGGHPTTAACPTFAYIAEQTAPSVESLLEAGAVLIGKTNLDQFATGLVGTRSPYGACANPFDETYIAGGSSSGSAVAVSAGLVSFSLGTDTAGSGRVPAAFTNIVGLKPTRGVISTRGVVPACRSLDCVSVLALTVDDARAVLRASAGFDAGDPFSRRPGDGPAPPRTFGPGRCCFGVPRVDQLEFFGNAEAARLFDEAVARLDRSAGDPIEIDIGPLLEAARLLYEGPWVAERYIAIRAIIEKHPEDVHPVTRGIIAAGAEPSAVDSFSAYYRLRDLRRAAQGIWDRIDVLVTPTAGTIYTIKEVLDDPLRLNSNLGYYTNFMNLLDLAGLAVPAGFQENGLPFGVTLVAPAFSDEALCAVGDAIHRGAAVSMGATGVDLPEPEAGIVSASDTVRIAVNGAHMSSLPLNHQLTERGARLLRACRTAPRYRLFALDGFDPPRPGLLRAEPGRSIEVEVWEVAAGRFGSFVAGIPAPLGIGTIELEDGETVNGFLCEPYATETAQDISELGGWRAYLAASERSEP